MLIATTIAEVRAAVREAKLAGRTVGLVPTMGALHEGHARLIELCRDSSDFRVVSIFVNPTQFGPNEDYSRYPRTWESDRAICEQTGAHAVFLPGVDEMYPGLGRGEETVVAVPRISSILEGAIRPGHFQGVATVVSKLFNIVQPDLAWFGLKDYQQTVVIRRMVADLNMPVAIRLGETVREPDGLALSSRNRYLDPQDRQAAVILSQALRNAVDAVAAGERDPDRVRQIFRTTIESQPRAQLDYAEVADAETLERPERLGEGRSRVALLAVRFGSTRLIDNALLPTTSGSR